MFVALATNARADTPSDNPAYDTARVIAGGASAAMTFINMTLATSDRGSTTWGLVGVVVGTSSVFLALGDDEGTTFGVAAGVAAFVTGLISVDGDHLPTEPERNGVSVQPTIKPKSFGAALTVRF